MTALIETVRVVGGRAPLWELHAARVRDASAALGLDVRLPPAPDGGPDRVIRYEMHGSTVTATTRDPSVPASLCLHVSVVPHQDYPWKTADRHAFDLAFAEARAASADDALLLATEGRVREASRWAIVWQREDGRIGAPPLSVGVLQSVARGRLGLLVPGGIVEEELDIGQLCLRPVAALNAARGPVRVVAIDGWALPTWAQWDPLVERFWP
jgi:branched-subunit amino acid aminotransferase/4-amino-4-deoxychorismate lyase